MRRREFITLIGGVATWPLGVWAQKVSNLREISHENSTSECRSSAVVGLGNGTKRQRSGGPWMDETDTS
jgi:hypothetical protein